MHVTTKGEAQKHELKQYHDAITSLQDCKTRLCVIAGNKQVGGREKGGGNTAISQAKNANIHNDSISTM